MTLLTPMPVFQKVSQKNYKEKNTIALRGEVMYYTRPQLDRKTYEGNTIAVPPGEGGRRTLESILPGVIEPYSAKLLAQELARPGPVPAENYQVGSAE